MLSLALEVCSQLKAESVTGKLCSHTGRSCPRPLGFLVLVGWGSSSEDCGMLLWVPVPPQASLRDVR